MKTKTKIRDTEGNMWNEPHINDKHMLNRTIEVMLCLAMQNQDNTWSHFQLGSLEQNRLWNIHGR